jgi:hypothetical protein
MPLLAAFTAYTLPGSVGIPVGVFGVNSLDSQDFAASGPAGFEDFLPGARSHPRPEAMHTSAVTAFWLISSFGHGYITF